MGSRTEEIIKEYREKRIQGKCIDLVPFAFEDVPDVVALRNQKKNQYFLHQPEELTQEAQKAWLESYQKRADDLYWCIRDKEDAFLGTLRIYEVDEETGECIQGSFIISEEHAQGAPYAVEAELLSLDFIFEVLRLKTAVNTDRTDNKVMNNLSKKLGFRLTKTVEIREVEYNHYVLSPDDYRKNRDKFQSIIDYWAVR